MVVTLTMFPEGPAGPGSPGWPASPSSPLMPGVPGGPGVPCVAHVRSKTLSFFIHAIFSFIRKLTGGPLAPCGPFGPCSPLLPYKKSREQAGVIFPSIPATHKLCPLDSLSLRGVHVGRGDQEHQVVPAKQSNSIRLWLEMTRWWSAHLLPVSSTRSWWTRRTNWTLSECYKHQGSEQ